MVLGTVALGLARLVGKQVGLEALKMAAREVGLRLGAERPGSGTDATVRALAARSDAMEAHLERLSAALVEMSERTERFFARLVFGTVLSLAVAVAALLVAVLV